MFSAAAASAADAPGHTNDRGLPHRRASGARGGRTGIRGVSRSCVAVSARRSSARCGGGAERASVRLVGRARSSQRLHSRADEIGLLAERCRHEPVAAEGIYNIEAVAATTHELKNPRVLREALESLDRVEDTSWRRV